MLPAFNDYHTFFHRIPVLFKTHWLFEAYNNGS